MRFRHTAILLLAGLLAAPLAGALSVGVDAAHVDDLNAAGGHATYGQTWVGAWMRTSGWSAYESDLRSAAAAGATPVVMWYYWGDSISVSCVENGCNGLSKGGWDAMAVQMAQHTVGVLGTSTPFLVVLEPEFNKGGIAQWETFDGYLADQANAIRAVAPNAKIVLGFGSWGGYDIFDRAAAASDYVGMQYMRGSTRDAASDASAPSASILATVTDLHARFGKPVLLDDLAIASYGAWESVQLAAMQDLQAHAQALADAGLAGIVWRYVYDNAYSSGYFGPAEVTWGLKSTTGVAKPAWSALVALSNDGTAATAPSFRNVRGNAWWVEADVSGAPTSVAASVNGGPWQPMGLTPWGSWAVTTSAPAGASLVLHADFGGSSVESTYAWSG